MGNWWISDHGVNTLKGIEDDPDNPPRLTPDQIAYFLRTSRKAREDFEALYPSLLPEEQERLASLVENNRGMTRLMTDDMEFNDALQSRDARSGVRLTWVKR